MSTYAQALKDSGNPCADTADSFVRNPAGAVRPMRLVTDVRKPPAELLQKEAFCCNIATD